MLSWPKLHQDREFVLFLHVEIPRRMPLFLLFQAGLWYLDDRGVTTLPLIMCPPDCIFQEFIWLHILWMLPEPQLRTQRTCIKCKDASCLPVFASVNTTLLEQG
jgi:hypothetical protein